MIESTYTKRIYLLPIVVFIWFPFTFLLTYIIAVCLRDVEPFFPYISDTGTFSPESCIFGQLLNTGSIIMGIVMYIRYKQILDILRRHPFEESVDTLNTACMWFGFIASFGISVVGNFQETNTFAIHLIGAGLAFGLGTVYQCLQTMLSFKVYPVFGSIVINYIRLLIAIICVIFSILTFVFALLSFTQFRGTDITKWKWFDGGYSFHLISAISEWITAIATMCYILSFTGDFMGVTVFEPDMDVMDNYTQEFSGSSVNRY